MRLFIALVILYAQILKFNAVRKPRKTCEFVENFTNKKKLLLLFRRGSFLVVGIILYGSPSFFNSLGGGECNIVVFIFDTFIIGTLAVKKLRRVCEFAEKFVKLFKNVVYSW